MPRLWTLDEANAALFHVRQLLEEARRHLADLREAQRHIEDLRIVHGEAVHDPECDGHLDWRNHLGRFQEAKRELEDILGRFADLGVEVKDVEAGLVDFRALWGDQEVYLCWRDGEERITHWHTLEEGFAGRQPVPESGRTGP